MTQFVTIKEAARLAGKSEITIRRLIKRLLKINSSRADQLIRQEQTRAGFIYALDRELLVQEGLLTSQEHTQTDQVSSQTEQSDYADDKAGQEQPAETQEQGTGQATTQEPDQVTKQVNDPLIKTLDSTVETLKGQLTAKDDQIAKLIQSRENADLLIANLSHQLQLKEPEPAGVVEAEVTEIDREAGPEVEIPGDDPLQAPKQGTEDPKKRSGWWPFSKN